ncbi:MAG: hypothetical protein AAFX78_14790 [Cyanobacteria bacterium J06638_20]
MRKIGLSIVAASLAFVASAPAAEAMPPMEAMEFRNMYGLDPFELTFFAYQGRLRSYDIPGYSTLVSRLSSNSLDAEDVIEAAIEGGDLSAAAINDSSYVGFVEDMLDNLVDQAQ